MTRNFLLALAMSAGVASAAESGYPTVRYKGGILVASPAPYYKAAQPSVEILETEECSASAASKTTVRVSGKCEFLRAMFSYHHQEPKSGKDLRTLVGFTFSSQGSGHSLMVSGPFVSAKPN